MHALPFLNEIMQIYAIIGEHLVHSASPVIQAHAFQQHHIDANYIKIEIVSDEFDQSVRKLKSDMRYAGFNITIPYKTRILPYIDDLDQSARKTGAVNTIRAEKGKWTGYNTDVEGFLSPLESITADLHGCLILGAGGAARAVVYALVNSAEHRLLTICMRNTLKGQKLKEDFKPFLGQNRLKIVPFSAASDMYPEYDLIVNTTPVGMYPDTNSTPVQFHKPLSKPLTVYDLIYNPPQTRFLQEAQDLEGTVKTISGVDMLIAQAAQAFNIWTGLIFPIKEAHQLILNTLSEARKKG